MFYTAHSEGISNLEGIKDQKDCVVKRQPAVVTFHMNNFLLPKKARSLFKYIAGSLLWLTLPDLSVCQAQVENKSGFVTKTEISKKANPVKKADPTKKNGQTGKNEVIPKGKTDALPEIQQPDVTAEANARLGDWSVHIHGEKDQKVCFTATEPKESRPAPIARNRVIFYISTWPGQRVRHEVSVTFGYPVKANTEPVAEIGNESFHFFTKGEKAFLENAAEELKLIETMKKGKNLVFKGISARGTATTDTYSLSGLSAALAKVEKDCAF